MTVYTSLYICIHFYKNLYEYGLQNLFTDNTILFLKKVNFNILPNQELSVLYGGPILNYGEQLSLCVPYMLRVSMTEDLAHLQYCLIYRVKLNLYAEWLIYRQKECLYAERNGYFPFWNNLKKIVSLTSICILSSYFLFVDASLIKKRK